MFRKAGVRFTVAMAGAILAAAPAVAGGPRYASPEAERLIGKMLEAHGGIEAWRRAPSVSYTHTYVSPYDPSDPWTSEEIVEQGRRRVYQRWPRDSAEIIYDGESYYGVNWQRGNPPRFTAHLAYYFANLPWMTQDDGVVLGVWGRGRLPGRDESYHIVRMTFDPATGVAPRDVYDLFIDPDDYVLRGFHYMVTYGAILDAMGLPPVMKYIGPLVKIYDSFERVDGLLVPTRFHTVGMDGSDWGYHVVSDWSFARPFEDSLVRVPQGAVRDLSSAERGTGDP